MDEFLHDRKRNPNPKTSAGFLSSATFLYTLPLLRKSLKKSFTEDDIYETLPEHRANHLGVRAMRAWNGEFENFKKNGKRPSLAKVLLRLFGRHYLIIFVCSLIMEIGTKVYLALSLGGLLESYREKNDNSIYIYTGSIIVCLFIQLSIYHPYQFKCKELTLKIQVACSSLIYSKMLKLSKSAFHTTTTGQIINLLSNDLMVFQNFVNLGHYLCIIPLQTSLLLYLTYRQVGKCVIFTAIAILICIPLHYVSGRLTFKYRQKTSIRRDERIRLMNEIIQGINIVKMYAWEKPFTAIILLCRKLEIRSLAISCFVKTTIGFHVVFTTILLFTTIISSTLFDVKINANDAFVIAMLFFTFAISFMVFMPQAIIALQESKVSVGRILNFLLCEEMQIRDLRISTDYVVSVKDASAKWNNQLVLSKLNFNIKFKSLTAIIGTVGSGKSSILHAILQELPLSSGDLAINGTLSYASQEPWIFSASVRTNILFGKTLDKERYKNVVYACALDQDFKSFSSLDNTIVGERGALLSGGQKARVNLARAVYRDAHIYLLDDPLSSVDTHVGKHIFENCIKTFLKDKTVILVTHQLQYLKHVDHIIVIENGQLVVEGSPSELEKSGFDFAKYLDKDEIDNNKSCTNTTSLLEECTSLMNKNLKEKELHITGGSMFSIYKNYILASKSYIYVFFVLFLFVITQMLNSYSYYFITQWVKMEKEVYSDYDYQRQLNTYIYSSITLSSIILMVIRTLFYTTLVMKCSRKLHDNMFEKVVRASMHFFNIKSPGEILNRFAKDQGTIDEYLPRASLDLISSVVYVLGIFGLICITNPWFLIPSFVLLSLVFVMRKYYLMTSLDVLRVENITRSPIYGHANTSLQGLTTIRASGVQEVLTNDFNAYHDCHTSAYYLSATIATTFGYWVDMLSFIYIAIITVYFAINKEYSEENIGLTISQGVQLLGLVQWGMKQITEVENYLISVERVLEYNKVQQERELDSVAEHKPPATWPQNGRIEFKRVFLKYPGTDRHVLKDINFTVESLQKIGIVGRTGAGKSSIITALFQLAETEGVIIIDNVDIKQISLHNLRKKMSIIPQDPVLFSGTVRKNLDPFNNYTDETLWKALDEVRLKKVIESMAAGLSSELSQNGSNLSVGQRQLICLARAIIRKNKILILDEATANVDLQTDKIIQETIRNKFSNCTVLTVAHRLNTIMDSDKVLVMDAGIVVEFDHPYTLLQNEENLFYKMVQQTEESTFKVLIDISKKHYRRTEEKKAIVKPNNMIRLLKKDCT